MVKRMYDLFLKKDALLIEVNPYAEDAITGKCKSFHYKITKFYVWYQKHILVDLEGQTD